MQVRRIELARAAGAGAAPPALLEALLGAVALERVTRLRCGEGAVPAWGPGLLRRLVGLRSLNLSACGLTALPPGAGRSFRSGLPVRVRPHHAAARRGPHLYPQAFRRAGFQASSVKPRQSLTTWVAGYG